MTQIAYETVDVFAEAQFGGNPLAIIADARGVSDRDMQAVAREFNYSEVTFVLPPAHDGNTARVRIFTPTNEIPFAGHPNVGTAFALARAGSVFGRATGDVMRFEEGAGLVEVEVLKRAGVVTGARIRAPRELDIGPEVAPSTIAACASLADADIVTTRHQPTFASVGLPFAFAELASLDALASATPNSAAFRSADERHPSSIDRFSLFLYTRTGARSVRARMFAPLSNILEDPATGSASAALVGLLASFEADEEGYELTIAQGVEMGRPSVIHAAVRAARGGGRSITVAGDCVPVMRGTVTLLGRAS
jgi:trans-2,3-dihydro-3-hydroxyanthranilate isomerase